MVARDVFSLIGPKRFDSPWKDIEAQGYIAPADCVEVRVTLTEAERMTLPAEPDVKYRRASRIEPTLSWSWWASIAASQLGDRTVR